MSRRAWIYIWGILLTGAVLSVLSLLPYSTPSPTVWTVFALLAALATGAQLFKAEAPNHMLFYASPVFFFAGVVLLPPGSSRS